MSGYYRTIFAISKGDAPSSQVIGDAWQCVRDWVAREGEYGAPYRSSEQRGAWEGVNGDLRLYDRALNDMRLCNLVWTRADADASGSRWRLSLRLATDGSVVEADIEVRGLEGDGGETLSELTARPPSVLGQLVDRFECSIGDELLQTAAKRIGVDESDAFVRDEILSESRRMPLLVVTDFRRGGNVVNANDLQHELTGLARVFAYNHNTAWNIARDLPQSLWCYDGAVRLYAPGCSEDDLSQRHPYWLRWDIDRVKRDNRLWQMLRDECVNKTPRQSQGRLYSRVEDRINDEETDALKDKIEQMEKDADPEGELLNQALEILTEDESENDLDSVSASKYGIAVKIARALKNRGDRFALENGQLRQTVAQIEEELNQAAPIPTDTEAEATDDAESRFKSVYQVVQHANENLDNLRFLPSAFRSARKSPFLNTDKLYETLEILSECGQARANDTLGVSVENWLGGRSVDYTPFESESTMKEYGEQRVFRNGRNDLTMQEHIKLGGGGNRDPQIVMRLHFIWSASEKRWLIGHVGRHLDTD